MDIDLAMENLKVAHKQLLRIRDGNEYDGALIRRPFRGTRKAYVTLEEAGVFELLKAAHIKIGTGILPSPQKDGDQ